MNEQNKALLKGKIDRAKVISFDIFDTLLFRKTNTPETVFDLVGRHFGIHGFRKLRMDEQNEASRRAYTAYGYPHADMDQIYAVLAEHTEIPVDWNEVKHFEIQMERDALVANGELLEIYQYAKKIGKRVIVVSDMYLPAEILGQILREKGFEGFDHLYCSANEHKAKFNRDLFELVAQKENVPFADILHIGDKSRDDGEYPESYGIQTFVYHREANLEKLKNAGGSDVDNGLYKILADPQKGFWYNLGVEIGGPLYMGLYRYLLQKSDYCKKKIFFLSRDGYNLYHLFKENGYENIEYLYTSRRALTMASIENMNERDVESLPPYTYGQTVGEILDYLCVPRDQIQCLKDAGFSSFEDVIRTDEDRTAFRKLYALDRDVFLAQCKVERENARQYFEKIDFFREDAICFDCGWQGSSQELIEQFKKTVGCEMKHEFVYFGIKHGAKSIRQLHSRHYDAYLFDFYRNFVLQSDLHENVAMYEIFFSAPHESVFCYGEQGQVLFEEGNGNPEKADILHGILAFVREGLPFVEKYGVEYTPQLAVAHLKRLIHLPTAEEAVTIGNLQNVDGFARKQGEQKYIAYVTREQLESNPHQEIYWLTGLLKRPDVPEYIKKECAARRGIAYPVEDVLYHLEDEQSIRNYHRWIAHQKVTQKPEQELSYKPSFSVVIPVYNTVTSQLEECFDSVLSQTYDNYELILVDDHSSWENVRPVLRHYETHEKVRVLYRANNGHISVATNDGIAAAKNEFIVFMDCDDTIEPDALYQFAKKLNENPQLDFLYSDDDKLTEDGKIRHMPFFKPEWSPDLFLNMMYTNHLATYRTSIVKATGGLRTAYNGSQDYDFTLRFMELSDNQRVGHVPKVLYHWRERRESVAFAMNSKSYASEAARYAKEDYIRRNGIKAHLEYIDGMSQYRIVYHVTGQPLVSIIIPSKDHPKVLRQCIESIRKYTSYANYEFVVVDNGSNDQNRKAVEQLLQDVGGRYIYDKAEFNFSKMCNTGAKYAQGEYLLFLNDDIEIFQPQWLERMLGHAQQKHTGAVGAKLYYPQSTLLQHTGVSNTKQGPVHSFMRLDDSTPYYFGWNRVENNCIAVTGACLLLATEKFRQVGGFDEDLPVAYNDVKLCFALHSNGYYNVVRNDVVAYHHESLSRGSDHVDDRKLIRLSNELTGLYAQYPHLQYRDPFLNENLEQWAAGLPIKQWHDELKQMDLSGCVDTITACVDSVEIADRVRIVGWAVLEGESQVETQERYIVFQDPFGTTYGARALPFARPDVAAHFDNAEYRYAGFECVLRKEDLRIDIMPYQVGVMIVDRSGTGHLAWNQETNVIRTPRPRPFVLPYRKLDSFTAHKAVLDIQSYLDECIHCGTFHRIRGFAYKKGNDHYCYEKKLILLAQDGQALEFDMYNEERVDVAYSFPQEHFLFNTGYLCYVFDNALESGKIYDVIIRLKNRFDPKNIQDVVTNMKISK